MAKTIARNEEDIYDNDSDEPFISNNRAEGSMSSNFSRSRSKNTSPSSSSQSSEIARSSKGTQIKTTKDPSAPASESQCLDIFPIEETDEQISNADETIEFRCDELEELEQQISFGSLSEVDSSN